VPTAVIDGPPVGDLDKKREFVRAVTDAMERYYGLPRGVYTVVIKENAPENVGVGGELICDRARKSKEAE
jgi:4-oxalocrotonate tautomerase